MLVPAGSLPCMKRIVWFGAILPICSFEPHLRKPQALISKKTFWLWRGMSGITHAAARHVEPCGPNARIPMSPDWTDARMVACPDGKCRP